MVSIRDFDQLHLHMKREVLTFINISRWTQLKRRSLWYALFRFPTRLVKTRRPLVSIPDQAKHPGSRLARVLIFLRAIH